MFTFNIVYAVVIRWVSRSSLHNRVFKRRIFSSKGNQKNIREPALTSITSLPPLPLSCNQSTSTVHQLHGDPLTNALLRLHSLLPLSLAQKPFVTIYNPAETTVGTCPTPTSTVRADVCPMNVQVCPKVRMVETTTIPCGCKSAPVVTETACPGCDDIV